MQKSNTGLSLETTYGRSSDDDGLTRVRRAGKCRTAIGNVQLSHATNRVPTISVSFE